MIINDLNTKEVGNPAWVALDDGNGDTYKANFPDVVADAAAEAVQDVEISNNTVAFTSSDVADGSATSWTTVTKLSSGEALKSLFAKVSQMFKNIRYLYKMLGTTDISSIGGGTVTGALSTLNSKITPTTLYRPISADQKSNWTYNVPHTGTLYLFVQGTVRAYVSINWNNSLIASVTMPNNSIALIQTVTVNVKKGDKISVNGLNSECFLASAGTCLLAGTAD